MRWTLTLLIANIFALSWIIHMHSSQDTRKEEARILKMETEDVTALRIQNVNMPDIVLEKRKQDWWITEPVQWSANPNAVQRILNQLIFVEREVAFDIDAIKESGKTLKDYGLEKPLLSFTISTSYTEQTIKLGAPTGLGNKLYALEPNSSRIAVIDKSGFDGFELELNSLRSEQIFDIPLYAVESLVIKLRNPDLTVRLAQNENTWKFESPISTQADNERVNALLNELSHLKVIQFIQAGVDTGAPPSLETPEMRITLRSKNNQQQTLLLDGEAEGGEGGTRRRYARLEDSPTLFTVMSEPFEIIRTRWEQLREHRILDIQAESVSAIEIRRENKKLTLQKLETGPWQIIEEKEGGELLTLPADSEVIIGLINHLNALQADSFVSDAPSEDDLKANGLQPALGEITLRGKETLKLLIGKIGDNDLRTITTSKTQSIYGIQDAAINLIEAQSYAYRSRTLLSLPESATIKTLRLIKLSKESDLALNTDPSAKEALKSLLNPFKAQAFIPAQTTDKGIKPRGASKSFPWRYRLELVVHLPGGEQAQEKTYAYNITELDAKRPLLGISTQGNQSFLFPETIRNALVDIKNFSR